MKNPNVLKAFLLCFVASVVASAVLSTCMVATHRTGRLGAVIDNLGGIKANASGLDLNAKKAFNAGAPTVGTDLTTKTYVDGLIDSSTIRVAAVTAASLPAYTYANGTAGVGATITANANGAFPSIDGVALVAGTDRFLLQNPAAVADAGVYLLTTQGSGGSAWVATRDTRLDSAAEFNARPFVVASNLGAVHGGGQYTYKIRDTITMGTTALFARRINMGTARPPEGFAYIDDITISANPALNTMLPGSALFVDSSTITATLLTNTSTLLGSLSITTSAAATSFGGLNESGSHGTAGRSYTLDTNITADSTIRMLTPVLSTGAAEYAANVGWISAAAASQVNPANAVAFIYDRPTSTNWRACCIVATVATCSDTGIAVATTPYRKFAISHEAGQLNAYFDIDDVQVASVAWSACPSAATGMFLASMMFSSVGASTKNGMAIDSVSDYIHYPAGRF